MSRFIRYAVLCILLWPSCLFRAIAQDTDKSSYNAGIVPSVQAYEMSRYGNVSPSLYTGAMSYSVPLYTYSDPDFSLPISLDYNYSGYRPSQHSGYVGLGWNLNCGGVITREIVGLPDDYDYNGLRGFYYLATSTAAAALRDSIANGSFVTTYEAFEHANYYCHSSPYVTDEQDASLYFGTTALYTDQPISSSKEFKEQIHVCPVKVPDDYYKV